MREFETPRWAELSRRATAIISLLHQQSQEEDLTRPQSDELMTKYQSLLLWNFPEELMPEADAVILQTFNTYFTGVFQTMLRADKIHLTKKNRIQIQSYLEKLNGSVSSNLQT